LCVVETADEPPPSELRELSLLAPGIGAAGNAIPFALGAKLARRQQPLVVVSERRFLLQHLDALALAASHQIPLRLVGPKSAGLEPIARAFSIELFDRGDGAVWKRLTGGDRGLFVACTG
jgi:hypothetical protein